MSKVKEARLYKDFERTDRARLIARQFKEVVLPIVERHLKAGVDAYDLEHLLMVECGLQIALFRMRKRRPTNSRRKKS